MSGHRACEGSGSRAENGAERAEKRVSGNGAESGPREKRSGARSGIPVNGNGAMSGSKKNERSMERQFNTLRSHALAGYNADASC